MKQTVIRTASILLAIGGVVGTATAQTPSSGLVFVNEFGIPYIQELGHYEGLTANPSDPGLARGAVVGIAAGAGCQKLNVGLIGIDVSPGVVSLGPSLTDGQAPRFVSVFHQINTDTTQTLSITLPSSQNVNEHMDILFYMNCEEGTNGSFVKYRVDEVS